jgi:hypothetical protein
MGEMPKMSKIALAFFGAAVAYALAGMALGMVMGATEDHTLAPVHAHINLLGWTSLALMGAFYGLAGAQTPVRLAWATFAVGNLGNLITLPFLALLLTGHANVVPKLVFGEVLIVVAMAMFGISVLSVARRTPA